MHHHHPPRLTRRRLFATVIPGAILAPYAFPQNAAETAARFKQMTVDNEKRGLADPFKGITANGTVEPNLFPVHSTGVPTTAVRNAAERSSQP
jgi:hypothetical protein